MSKHLSASTLRGIAQVTDMGEANRLGRAVQAIIEGKPFGASSLDGKIVATFEGVGFTEANFRETIVYCGQLMKRHRNGGGWVPVEQDERDKTKSFVAESVAVEPWAIVHGNARVLGAARIYEYAQVFGNARVQGNAEISQCAQVFGCATIKDNALVSGNAQVSGNVWVEGNAQVNDDAKVGGHVIVRDDAYVGGDVALSDQYAFSGSQVITSADDLRGVYPYISL